MLWADPCDARRPKGLERVIPPLSLRAAIWVVALMRVLGPDLTMLRHVGGKGTVQGPEIAHASGIISASFEIPNEWEREQGDQSNDADHDHQFYKGEAGCPLEAAAKMRGAG